MKALREKYLAQVAPHLSYFNDCKVPFAISECKSWINKIFDDVESLQQPKNCDGCIFHDDDVVGWDDWCCDCIRKWTIDRYEAKEQ